MPKTGFAAGAGVCALMVACGGNGPVTLASDAPGANVIAVDSNNVYWADSSGNGQVKKVPIGGGSTTSLSNGEGNVSELAVNASGLFWMNTDGQLVQVALADDTRTVVAQGEQLSIPKAVPLGDAVAADATAVYWGSWSGASPVIKTSLRGGTPAVLAPNQDGITRMAVDSNNVYWTCFGGTIVKAPIAGGDFTTLATQATSPFGIAVDADNVYWTNPGMGTIVMVPISGGTSLVLASGQATPQGVASDGTSVYWTNRGDGTVRKVPTSGGTPLTLASGQSSPSAIAVDAISVYWTTDGSVMKLTPK